jgi:hypothetical protein
MLALGYASLNAFCAAFSKSARIISGLALGRRNERKKNCSDKELKYIYTVFSGRNSVWEEFRAGGIL